MNIKSLSGSLCLSGGALAVLLTLTACRNGSPASGSPAEAAKTYLTYAYEKNYEQFANTFVFSSDSIEAGRHEANVRAVKELLDEKGEEFYVSMDSVSQIRILSEKIDETGDRAEVTLETVCKGGLRDTTVHELVKREDGWKFYENK